MTGARRKIHKLIYFFLIVLLIDYASADQYMSRLKPNADNFDKITIGMSRQDVELLMGKNQEVIPFSSHGRKKTVSNPFKTEIIQAKVFGEEKFHPILRYDYVIGFVETSDSPGYMEFVSSPVFFNKGRVIGKGKKFYEREIVLEEDVLQFKN